MTQRNMAEAIQALETIWSSEGHTTNTLQSRIALAAMLLNGHWCWHPVPYGPGINYVLTRQEPALVHFNQKTRQFEIWTSWTPTLRGRT